MTITVYFTYQDTPLNPTVVREFEAECTVMPRIGECVQADDEGDNAMVYWVGHSLRQIGDRKVMVPNVLLGPIQKRPPKE